MKSLTSSSILLVGGCGYIGSFIYSRLLSECITPVVCDKLLRGNPLNVKTLECDYSTLTSADLDQFDTVIWFAGHSSVQQSVTDPEGALANNCINLLAFAKKLKSSTRFIYASSGSLYSLPVGESLSPSTESDLVRIPYQNAYDISKFAFDYLAEHFLSNFYALRMGTLSGWSPNLRTELLFNSMSISAATKGEVYLKNSDAYRTVLFLDDLWLLIKKFLTADAPSGFYNVGSVSAKIGEFAEQIAATWGAKVVDQGKSETYSFWLNTGRMDALLAKNDDDLSSITNRSLEFVEQCRKHNLI